MRNTADNDDRLTFDIIFFFFRFLIQKNAVHLPCFQCMRVQILQTYSTSVEFDMHIMLETF